MRACESCAFGRIGLLICWTCKIYDKPKLYIHTMILVHKDLDNI